MRTVKATCSKCRKVTDVKVARTFKGDLGWECVQVVKGEHCHGRNTVTVA